MGKDNTLDASNAIEVLGKVVARYGAPDTSCGIRRGRGLTQMK